MTNRPLQTDIHTLAHAGDVFKRPTMKGYVDDLIYTIELFSQLSEFFAV